MLALVLAGGGLPASSVLAQPQREYDVKSALLFNFTRFVDWPPEAFGASGEPVVIGILGRDPFGATLEEMVRGELCRGRPIRVDRFRNVEAALNCEILFVAASEAAELPRILRVLRGRAVLTVADFEGFALRGGMIRFLKDPNGRIHLQINLEAAKAAGLTISAKLLRVAEVVSTEVN